MTAPERSIRSLARRLRPRRPSPSMVVALMAVVLAMGGVAMATIPGPDGAIHGCYDTNGVLRVIDSAATCAPRETALNWNQAGPMGPGGATGASGAAGPPGAAGIGPAYSGSHDARRPLYTKDRTVVTLPKLPAGKYVLVGKMWVVNFAPNSRFVQCFLRAGVDFDRASTRLEANGDRATRGVLAFNVVHEFTQDNSAATISCATNGVGAMPLNPINDAGIAEVSGYDFKITAIRVSALRNERLLENPL